MTGNVYFIKCKGHGVIKIGYAKDVSKRRDELQTGCPFELQIMAVIPGTPRLERIFHAALAPWRLRGEWFAAGPITPVRKVLTLIDSGARPKTIQDVEMLINFKLSKGFGRGLNKPDLGCKRRTVEEG